MSQAQAAPGFDRLPWLADEPPQRMPQPPRGRAGAREAAGWGVAATLLIAGAAYWMGTRSGERPHPPQNQSSEVMLPAPKPSVAQPGPGQPQVVLEPAPEVSPAPVREVPIDRSTRERRAVERPSAAPAKRVATPTVDETFSATSPSDAAKAAKPAVNPDSKPLTAVAGVEVQGAQGRIVRIGAFGTRAAGEARLALHGTGLSRRGAFEGDRRRRPQLAWAPLLPFPDRHHVAGALRSAVPAHGAHPLELRRRRPAVGSQGR